MNSISIDFKQRGIEGAEGANFSPEPKKYEKVLPVGLKRASNKVDSRRRTQAAVSNGKVAMMEIQKRWWFFGWVLCLVMVVASTAGAEEEAKTRVTLTQIPGGGADQVGMAINEIEGVEAFPTEWFEQQVRGRAFQPEGITNRPTDLVWVMRGSNIAVLIDFQEDGEEEYLVRLITAAEGQPVGQFHVDRGEAGPTRGAIRLVVAELERFLGVTVVASDPPPVVEVDERTAREAESIDPEEVRRLAAEERAARAARLSQDWLWARAHFRFFQRNFTAAGANAVSTFNSAGFPGFELDIEAFPFVLGNPDMVEPGVYITYNHGFDGLRLVNQSAEPPVEELLTVHNFSVEGGMIYRLDSPLEEGMQQLRFKIGGRYEGFSIPENPVLRATSMISLVVGTRLVLPVGLIDRFAVTAAVDVVPFSSFSTGAEFFGQNSFSYGFGSEMGFVYEVMDNLFLSAGYTFRVVRSNFTGEGEEGIFLDSEVFEMNQGLRAGIVYQY